METIGIYNCYHGLPRSAMPFVRACGYNTYQRWDLGWMRWPSHHDAYYAEMQEELAWMKASGFQYFGLLSVNVRQCPEGGPEGYADKGFSPRDTEAMAERLHHLERTVKTLATADGFTIFAGDPGGSPDSTMDDLPPAILQIIELVRKHAPGARININTWGIAAWDHFTSPFDTAFWDKEAVLSRKFYEQPGIREAGVGMEFPLHNYYRSLALTCYARKAKAPPLYPSRSDVQQYATQGAPRFWGWPYFLVDECDDGYRPGTAGTAQSETRYIKRITEIARELGLHGLIANAFAENISAEALNLYAFAQFCQTPGKTPDDVIGEFAGLLAKAPSAGKLAEVLRFIENHSAWEAGLPERYRLPPLVVVAATSAVAALAMLDDVTLRAESLLPWPESPQSYLARLRARLHELHRRDGTRPEHHLE